VRIAADKRVNVKGANLRVVQDNPCQTVGDLGFGDADRRAQEEQQELINQAVGKFGFEPYDEVEIFGLSSEAGKELNGKTGMILNVAEGGERLEVRIVLQRNFMGKEQKTKVVNLKPGNLRKQGEETNAPPEPMGHVDLGVDVGSAAAGGAVGPFRPGDIVEVSGLVSEAGKPLNGQHGVVVSCLVSEERAELRLANGLKKLKFENITKMDWAGGDRVLVEVIGLTSESGSKMNGHRGFIRDWDEQAQRYEVRVTKDNILKLKPGNLRIIVNKAQ